MLSFIDPSHSRRSFLQVGSLALGGLTLPMLFPSASRAETKPITDKSVIFLFLHGGPSQIETFDPKMSAPAEIRSATGEVQTALPGVTFGASFPKLAQRADRVSIVRSFLTGDANHDIKPIVGKDTFGANLGAIYSYVSGTNHPDTGMPTNALLYPRVVDPTTQEGTRAFGNFGSVGGFGSAVAPFDPSSGGDLYKNMKVRLSMDRLDDRRGLLKEFDRMKASLDEASQLGIDATREKAFNLILGSVSEAFDLSKEDSKTVARYDTAPLLRPENINKKWNNHKNYADNAKTLGKLLLLARRLCERGCGFVTVTTNFVWDMHADSNNATLTEGMGYMGGPLDHALAAFLDDLESRSLSDQILLVVCGEMGRTPKINKNGGRDHWGLLSPLLLAGGGLKMGQVIGQSNKTAGEPQTEPIRNKHLISTIVNRMFDVGTLRVKRGLPREIAQMLEWDSIPGLG
jgi:hypothetical protein